MAKTKPGKKDLDSYTIKGTNKIVRRIVSLRTKIPFVLLLLLLLLFLGLHSLAQTPSRFCCLFVFKATLNWSFSSQYDFLSFKVLACIFSNCFWLLLVCVIDFWNWVFCVGCYLQMVTVC